MPNLGLFCDNPGMYCWQFTFILTCKHNSVLAWRSGDGCKKLKPKNGLENYIEQKMKLDEISKLVSSLQEQRLSTLDLLMNKGGYSL